MQIRGAVAEYERTLIVDRLRRGRLAKCRAGLMLPWTCPPYGYRVDPERPRDPAGVRLAEAEAAQVREMFEWYAIEGRTILGLAQRLTTLQVPTATGKRRWCPASVHRVLSNPVYMGRVYAGRFATTRSRGRHSPLQPVGRQQKS